MSRQQRQDALAGPGGRLSVDDLGDDLSTQRPHRPAREHMVQGDPRQRQLLCRAESLQVHADEGAGEPVGGLSAKYFGVRFTAAGPRLPEDEVKRASSKSDAWMS